MKKISDIPKRERPREKLQERGAEALSDLELLAVLVGKGTKGRDVMSVAERILAYANRRGAAEDSGRSRGPEIGERFGMPFWDEWVRFILS